MLASLVLVLSLSVDATGASLPPEDCVRLLRKARIEQMMGHTDSARALLWQAVEDYPEELSPLIALDRFHRRHPLSAEEADRYRSALHRRLLDPEAPLPLSVLKFLVEDREAGVEDLTLLLRGIDARLARQADAIRLLDAKALLLLRLDRPGEARQTLGRLFELRPEPAVLWRALELDLEHERWDEALELVRVGLSQEPRDNLLRSLELEMLARAGHLDELLERLAQLGDDHLPVNAAHLLLEVAWSLHDAGNDAAAESLFRRVLRIEERNEVASAALLHLYGSAEERLQHDREVTSLWMQTEDTQALLNEGAARLAAGDAVSAYALLERATGLEPDNELAWFNLGLAATQLERWSDAAVALQRAYELNPDRVETMANLGAALAKLERCPEAVPVLRRATVLRPEMRLAHYYLYVCYKEAGELDKATAALERYNRGE